MACASAPVPVGLRYPSLSNYRSLGDEYRRETIVALGSNGLDLRGGHPRLYSQRRIEATYSLNRRVLGCRVEHGPLTHDVIGHDETTGMSQLDGPCQVLRVIGFVGVDENEVEWIQSLRTQLRQQT